MKPFDEKTMRRHWESEATGYTTERQPSQVDRVVIDKLNPNPGDRLLEIGFGSFITGQEILHTYHEVHYIGVDFAEKFLGIARAKVNGQADLIKASAASLPFKLESFDLMLEMDAIHHFPKEVIPDVTAGLSTLLKSGGKFILVEDWAATPHTENEELAYSIQARRFLTSQGLEYHPEESEWRALFTRSGLELVSLEHIDRPLNFGRFEELDDTDSKRELIRLKELWGNDQPTTKMSMFVCRRP